MRILLAAALAGCLAATACGGREASPAPDRVEAASPPADIPVSLPTRADRPRIVILGDSLTAGLGLAPEEAYPSLLQARLDGAGLAFDVVNAGVSGDTSAGGLRRLDWALDGDVRVIVIALGGNDGLRGVPPEELRRNLAAIIEQSRSRGIDVVLAGMEAPPNFGTDYTARFRRVYSDLAEQHRVTLIPFLLEGVAGIEQLNQRDGIHPTAEGARLVAETVWSALEPVARAASRTGTPPDHD